MESKVFLPTGSNWKEHCCGSATTVTGAADCAAYIARIGVAGQCVEQRKIAEDRQQASRQDDGLPAYFVRQPTEENEARSGERECGGRERVGGRTIDPQGPLQKEHGIELSRVPDHGLPHRRAQQAGEHDLEVAPAPRRLPVAAPFDVVPRFFISRNTGLSESCMRIHTDTASSTMDSRNGMRQPQSLNASSPKMLRMPTTSSNAANRPTVAVV